MKKEVKMDTYGNGPYIGYYYIRAKVKTKDEDRFGNDIESVRKCGKDKMWFGWYISSGMDAGAHNPVDMTAKQFLHIKKMLQESPQ
jgi:hypothetical protein